MGLDERRSFVSCTLEERNKEGLKFIDHITRNADQIQGKVLEEILSRNANVEYLQRHGLDGRTDRESFKKVVPVVTYEDLASDIQRIANGDTSPVLCSEPITEFLTSSGTSGGERKLIPLTDDESKRRPLLATLCTSVMSQFVNDLEKGKAMMFYFIKSEAKTPGGVIARPTHTSYLKSKHFGAQWHDPYANLTSPKEAILCSDYFQSMYSQVLCALVQRMDVLQAGALFASSFIQAIKFIEKHWQSLCNDIRTGIPDINAVTDPTVRKVVTQVLAGPNPETADLLEAECRKESWKGIIKRLWPNTKYIDTIVTGAMSQYIPTLDYYCDAIPLVTSFYASSECYFGVNLNPLCNPREVAFTLLPSEAYFEFLPVETQEDGEVMKNEEPEVSTMKEGMKLIDLVNVEIGKEYEIVITTFTGLYRYRLGDILRVANFKNNAPQFNFVRRANVVLSIDSDKTDEVEIRDATSKAINHILPHNWSLIEYTTFADTSTIPGHYVLFWEISPNDCFNGTTDSISNSVMEDCCIEFEESLNSVYRQCRVSNSSIGPLEIRVVKIGTFDKLMHYAVSVGASVAQYKTPKCVKNPTIIELLNSMVVSKHFSPKCPKWEPGHKQWHNNH